jgi:hypothetical protein
MGDIADGLFSALNWPLEQAKKATPGEDWFDRPDWMPHEAWAASQVAGDLLLDPLNFVPVGLFAKGAKAAKAAGHQAGSGKGMLAGSTSNYIPNFYGLTDGARDVVSPAEKVAVQALQKAKGMPYDQALGLVRKGQGMAGWGAQGVTDATTNLLSPKARALHKEQGINPAVQRIVKETVAGKPKPRDIEKAAANVNYLSHMHSQSGRTGPLNPQMAEIAQRSNLEPYTPNASGTISEMMQRNAGTVKETGAKNVLSDADAKMIEDHVNSSWGPTETVVMKRARSGTGGNHYNDLFRKMAPIGDIRKAFTQKGSVADYFTKHPKGDKYYVKEITDDGAVWLGSRGRNVGTAVTEGGVNWTMKIDPDGTLMGVISDKHDFLEKTPLLGKGLEKALPNDLVAVTPPMFIDIRSLRKQIPGKTERNIAGVQRKKASKEASNLTLLEEFASAKPSEMGVKAEQLKQAGMLSGAAAIAGGNE